MQDELYTYVIVRKDIPLLHQVVQAGHAAHEAGKRFGTTDKINNLIYLQVNDKQELIHAMEHLEMNNVSVNAYFEPDYRFGLTAIATQYISDTSRKFLKKFSLWNPKEAI